MARSLRIEKVGGRHHATSRGNERRAIFRDDRDRHRFLELLAELPKRFGLRIHAWVLMDNHYHLLVETPEANLSTSLQWLNIAYSVWFNRRHQRAGHLFQGRFASFMVGDDASWMEVARYVHLNPVRVAGLGLGKADRKRQRTPGARDPGPDLVARRLETLRTYPWSSFRAYAGLAPAQPWLWTEHLAGACGGTDTRLRRQAFRRYHEDPLREGRLESIRDRVVANALLGTEEFINSIRTALKSPSEELSGAARLRHRIEWERIVAGVEQERGEKWEDFRDRHGDWGRDIAIYLGKHEGRLRLRELACKAGGISASAVGKALSRITQRVATDNALGQRLRNVRNQLSNVQI